VRASDARDVTDIARFDQIDILPRPTSRILLEQLRSHSQRTCLAYDGHAPGARAPKPAALAEVLLRSHFGGALEPGQKVVFEPTISLTGFAFAQGRRLSPLVSVLQVLAFSSYDTELEGRFQFRAAEAY